MHGLEVLISLQTRANSTCSTCCTANPQQINNVSTFRQIHNKSTTSQHVKMLWICGLAIDLTLAYKLIALYLFVDEFAGQS
jgi:hypothetical protein